MLFICLPVDFIYYKSLFPVRTADNLTNILCRCHEIWEP